MGNKDLKDVSFSPKKPDQEREVLGKASAPRYGGSQTGKGEGGGRIVKQEKLTLSLGRANAIFIIKAILSK